MKTYSSFTAKGALWSTPYVICYNIDHF